MGIATPMEVELKLAVADMHLNILLNHPTLASTPSKKRYVANTYYDTPTGDLAHARIAVRLRETNDGIVQTVKTAGTGGGGLSSRQEWEWPLTSPHIDQQALSQLPIFQGRHTAMIAHLAPRLSTNFNRQCWQIVWQGSHIEVVLDKGEIVSKGTQTHICELELELKTGEAEALWSLAIHLSQQVPLRPSDTSKAARGNALALNQWQLPEATSASGWLHRATVALDAYHDSGQKDHFLAAQQALNQLAKLPELDETLRPIALRLSQEINHTEQPTVAYGYAALTLARRLASQTALS